jgi:putative toxin-antitoxin system antitoxin component (TIGR02293 family)
MARRTLAVERRRSRGRVGLDTAKVLGLKDSPRDQLAWVELLQTGLPSSTIESLTRVSGWTRDRLLKALDLVPRTLARRLETRTRLTPTESERVLRLARVLARASDVLEGEEKAKAWIDHANRALAGRTPMELLRTDIGTELVMTELTKIDHGMWP